MLYFLYSLSGLQGRSHYPSHPYHLVPGHCLPISQSPGPGRPGKIQHEDMELATFNESEPQLQTAEFESGLHSPIKGLRRCCFICCASFDINSNPSECSGCLHIDSALSPLSCLTNIIPTVYPHDTPLIMVDMDLLEWNLPAISYYNNC